jgi:hypothetical protein
MFCNYGYNKKKTGTREEEHARIEASFKVLEVPEREKAEILEALDSTLWDWYKDCDGCTFVGEVYWPTRFFPPCLRHDFDFLTGQQGAVANNRFYRLQRIYGMNRVRASIRWIGVTAAWFSWFKWRNKWRD